MIVMPMQPVTTLMGPTRVHVTMDILAMDVRAQVSGVCMLIASLRLALF